MATKSCNHNTLYHLILILLAGALLYLNACSGKSQAEMHLFAEAAADRYSTEDELLNTFALVITVQKDESEKNVVEKFGNDAYYGYTLSKVKVSGILKNDTGHEISVEPGNAYILYLDYSSGDEWYYIVTGMQGKIPVSGEEEILYGNITEGLSETDREEYESILSLQKEIREAAL